MKISIPKGLKGQPLFDFLKSNKSELLKQKCAFNKTSDDVDFIYEVTETKKEAITKDDSGQIVSANHGELMVTIVGNTCFWIDSDLDMLIPDNWKKTIKESGPEGKDRIYHLKDHEQRTSGIVGYPQKIYSQNYTLSQLGLSGMGETQCLVSQSLVKQSLDRKTYELYKDKKVKQHSIGLQYVKIDIAINDINSPAEFILWQKYYPLAINKEVADQYGFFYVVSEIKLKEISAVLFGANELTPTIESEEKNNEPSNDDTQKNEPPQGTHTEKSFLFHL